MLGLIGKPLILYGCGSLFSTANDFQFSLVIQEGEVFVRSALPVTIPGLFTLAVRFYHSPSDFEESSVFDPSLADTSSIDIKIPREKLPTGFREFAVLVALKVGNDLGPFTTSLSNRISKQNSVSYKVDRVVNT